MSKQQEAQQFLNDLDSLNAPSTSKPNVPTTSDTTQPPNEAEALAFLDEITQKSSEPTKTTVSPLQPRTVIPRASSRISLRKGVEGISRSASPVPAVPTHGKTTSGSSSSGDGSGEASSAPSAASGGGGSWGWGSVWSSASAVVKQARDVVDEQVKNLPKNEQAKKWSEGMLEYVKSTQLDKLGQDLTSASLSTFNDIMNVVVPPIPEHEVTEVFLIHDMRGYEGVVSLANQALTKVRCEFFGSAVLFKVSKVLERVDGGDVIVTKGESRPKEVAQGHHERDLGAIEGYDAAFKLAKANSDEMIKNNAQKAPTQSATGISSPINYTTVYLCIQPYLTWIPFRIPQVLPSSAATAPPQPTHIQFLLHLTSPSYALTHTTATQAVPSWWIDAFQAEDSKSEDVNSWVEDILVDVLRLGIEVIGQEYMTERMGWGQRAEIAAATRESKEPTMERESQGERSVINMDT